MTAGLTGKPNKSAQNEGEASQHQNTSELAKSHSRNLFLHHTNQNIYLLFNQLLLFLQEKITMFFVGIQIDYQACFHHLRSMTITR